MNKLEKDIKKYNEQIDSLQYIINKDVLELLEEMFNTILDLQFEINELENELESERETWEH